MRGSICVASYAPGDQAFGGGNGRVEEDAVLWAVCTVGSLSWRMIRLLLKVQAGRPKCQGPGLAGMGWVFENFAI